MLCLGAVRVDDPSIGIVGAGAFAGQLGNQEVGTLIQLASAVVCSSYHRANAFLESL